MREPLITSQTGSMAQFLLWTPQERKITKSDFPFGFHTHPPMWGQQTHRHMWGWSNDSSQHAQQSAQNTTFGGQYSSHLYHGDKAAPRPFWFLRAWMRFKTLSDIVSEAVLPLLLLALALALVLLPMLLPASSPPPPSLCGVRCDPVGVPPTSTIRPLRWRI